MIITKKKHDSIVSMKNLEIAELNLKLEGVKDLYDKKELELYKANKEANKLSDKLDQVKGQLKDADIAYALILDDIEILEHENYKLEDKILNIEDDNVNLQKENSEYKKQLDFIKELLRQYKWYIDKSIEVGSVTHTLTLKDMQKFHSKEGVEGLIKLYQLAAMMQ